VSAVPAPAGLIALLRVKHPASALKTALGWAHLPPMSASDLNHAIAGESIGEVIDVDEAIDVALVNGGHGLVPAWAVSAGVRSLEAARAGLAEKLALAPGEGGAYWIRPAAGGEKGSLERPCEIAPSAGASPWRLVCGASDEALGYLAPYLARTLPRQAWASDVHVELHTEPIKPFAKMMRNQAPALLESMLGLRRTQEPALAELVEALVGDMVDLVGDLGKTQVDVMLDPEGASASLHAGFESKTSLVAQLATEHPERADVPLASFWRLPDDSDTAVFSRGYDVAELAHARDLSLSALGAMLGKEGLPEAEQKALAAAVHDILTDAPLVYARGSDVVAVQKALLAFQTAKEGPAKAQAARVAIEPYLGWWVFGFEEPPARLLRVFRGAVAAWNRPAMSKWLKSHVEGVPAPTLRALPATALPKDAYHLELSIFIGSDESAGSSAGKAAHGIGPGGPAAKAKGPPPTPIELHALVVPDGARTWLVVAADEKLAIAKAKGLIGTNTSGVGTLAVRPRLEALRDGRGTGGGFTSLRGWVALSPEPDAEAPQGKAGDPLGLLASLPSQGLTPIVVSASSSPATGDDAAGALDARLQLPRAAIEDIILFVLRSGGKL
jgi:hypothetical protein